MRSAELAHAASVGSFLEETPEGLFYMDRLQRDHDHELSLLGELGRHLHDNYCAALDAAVLGRTV